MTDTNTPADDPTFTDGSGIKRRTIMAGAAWTIPVVTLATATPAMAASNDLTLAFDKSSYSGTVCSTITGASVTATRNGAPASGVAVSVSLGDGYTFEDGSTSTTGTTDGNGRVSLPGIRVPMSGKSSTATATASGASATTAGLSGTSDRIIRNQNKQIGSLPSGTGTVTEIWGTTRNNDGLTRVYVLDSNNNLYASQGNALNNDFGDFGVVGNNVSAFGIGEGDSTSIGMYFAIGRTIRNQNKQIGSLPGSSGTVTRIWGTTRDSDGLTRVYALDSNNNLYAAEGNSQSGNFGDFGLVSNNVSAFGIGEGDSTSISVYYARGRDIRNQNKQIGTLPAGSGTVTEIWGTTRNSDGLTRVYALDSNNNLYTAQGNSQNSNFSDFTLVNDNVSAAGIAEGDTTSISVYYARGRDIRNQNKQIGSLPAGSGTVTEIWGTTRNSDGLTRVYALDSNNNLYAAEGNKENGNFGDFGLVSNNVSSFGIGEGDSTSISVYYAVQPHC